MTATGLRGLGITVGQEVGSTASATGAIVGSLVGGPLGGAVGAAAGQLIGAITSLFSGCGGTCVEATSFANQAAVVLQQNLDAYMSGAIPQSTAINNFNQIWNQLEYQCAGVPGAAGTNCIADRQQGACHYKAAPPQYPGQPAAGSCWNWFSAYLSPIQANNIASPHPANSTANQTPTSNQVGGTTATANFSSLETTIVLVGAALVGVVLLTSL